MINNRQNGRRRGRGGGGNPRNQGGGGQGQRDSGNRIDSRARGNAAQLLEKYKNMARDAQMSGDRVNTEYYLQFADHYFRVLADQRGRYEEQNPQRRMRDDFDADDDFGDEGDPIRTDEQPRAVDDYREQPQRQRDDRPRDDRPRERNEGDGRRFERGERGERMRDQPRPDRAEPVAEFPTAERRDGGMAPANDAAADPVTSEPRRRPRARKPVAAPIEDVEGEVVMDADRLPPSLGVIASEGEPIDEVKPRPRRRRASVAEV